MGMVGCFAAVDAETVRRLRDDPEQLEGILYPEDGTGEPPNYVEVDKAWHGIHYLLTGEADQVPEPLGLAILGGEEVGEDMGYGAARLLSCEQVQRVAAALPEADSLKSRFEPKRMAAAKVYPEVIWVREGDEALEYLIEYYRELYGFYQAAATRGDAVLLWLA